MKGFGSTLIFSTRFFILSQPNWDVLVSDVADLRYGNRGVRGVFFGGGGGGAETMMMLSSIEF